MANFITGRELTNELCNIIREARKTLLIVSPYIKLDDYFKNELFDKLKKNAQLHVLIAFGKNEKNPQRSIKIEDIDYFKDFPNVSIVYIPNLHAKYYANEKRGIITSINLYDYSFDNNVEYGVMSETNFFGGSDIDKQAWEETMKLLSKNYAVFVRRPNFHRRFPFVKDYVGSETKLDLTSDLINGKLVSKTSVFNFMDETYVDMGEEETIISREEYLSVKIQKPKKDEKLLSATNLGKLKDKSFEEVIVVMRERNLIYDKNTITEKGLEIGLAYKHNKNGNQWIVYPESLIKLL